MKDLLKNNISWIVATVTAIIAFLDFFVRLFIYLYNIGYAQYFNLSQNLVFIGSNDNYLFSLISYIGVALLFVVYYFMIYSFAFRSGGDSIKTLVSFLVTILINFIIVCLCFAFLFLSDYNVFEQIRLVLKAVFLDWFWVFFLLFSIILLLPLFIINILIKFKNNIGKWKNNIKDIHSSCKNKPPVDEEILCIINKEKIEQEIQKKKTHTIKCAAKIGGVVLSLMFIVTIPFSLSLGHYKAEIKNNYKILSFNDKKYAVVYENTDEFVLSICAINDNNDSISIDINSQKIVEKKNIDYKTTCFNSISIEKE